MSLNNIIQPQNRETAVDRLAKVLGIVNSGAGIAANVVGIKEGIDKGNREDTIYKQQQAVAAQEQAPDSPLSKMARDQATQIGIELPDSVSYSQLKNTGLATWVEKKRELDAQQGNELAKVHATGDEARKTELVKLQNTPPNSDQSKAALFGKRMQQAEQVFSKLSQNNFDPTTVNNSIQRSSLYPNMYRDSDVQSQDQAERNFLNAVLRRESGAVISPGEFDSGAKQYFPKQGDSSDILKQKAENRALAIEAMHQESGRAWDKLNQPEVNVPVNLGRQSGGLIPEALANNKGPSFSAEDLQAYHTAQTALKANPHDAEAIKTMGILNGRGLK